MSVEKNLEELFNKWNELNKKVGSSFGQFDFETIKKIRKEQRAIEDQVYEHVLQNAPDKIKKLLPEDCGEFEIGFDSEEKKFYFLMYDPDQEVDEEPARVDAITFNLNKTVDIIKDFKQDEDDDE